VVRYLVGEGVISIARSLNHMCADLNSMFYDEDEDNEHCPSDYDSCDVTSIDEDEEDEDDDIESEYNDSFHKDFYADDEDDDDVFYN
jgi:hypothetical protein